MLARERAVAAAGLAILTVLAWAYVWERAGTGMSAGAMTAFTFFPQLYPHVGGEMDSGVRMFGVSYKGTGAMVNAVIGGEVQV